MYNTVYSCETVCLGSHNQDRSRLASLAPVDYTVPEFPSLYWPFRTPHETAKYLYYAHDIWRFTFFWTLLIYEASHLAASGYAVGLHWKKWKLMWTVPLVYLFVGGVEAIAAGTVVGLMYVLGDK